VDVGVVAIKGLNSNHYLAISRRGELYGAVSIRVTGSNAMLQRERDRDSDSVELSCPYQRRLSLSLLLRPTGVDFETLRCRWRFRE